MKRSLRDHWKDRRSSLLVRLTLFCVVFLFIVHGRSAAELPPMSLLVLPGLFLALTAAQFFASQWVFGAVWFQGAVLLADISLLSASIYMTQDFSGDLYLLYFLTILGAGFTRQVWHVGLVAASAGAFYGFNLYAASPDIASWDTLVFLRIPFFVLVAVMVSFHSMMARRTEDDLSSAQAALQQAFDRLSSIEKLSMVARMAAGVAHELKNPLSGVIGNAQFMLDKYAADEKNPLRPFLERIVRQGYRASTIADSFGKLSKPDAPESAPVNFNELVEDCLRLQWYDLVKNHVTVKKEFDVFLPETTGDYPKLQQVIMNLLVNAQHALTDFRGDGTITLRTSAANGRLRVEIEDDGPGIPTATLSKIFDPFFTTKPREKGTGLGLSISQAIVEAHGGRLCAENGAAGALFVLDIPIRMPVAETRSAPAAPRPQLQVRPQPEPSFAAA